MRGFFRLPEVAIDAGAVEVVGGSLRRRFRGRYSLFQKCGQLFALRSRSSLIARPPPLADEAQVKGSAVAVDQAVLWILSLVAHSFGEGRCHLGTRFLFVGQPQRA